MSDLEAADGITLQEGVFASQPCPGLLGIFQIPDDIFLTKVKGCCFGENYLLLMLYFCDKDI